jgi:hypothetical protein
VLIVINTGDELFLLLFLRSTLHSQLVQLHRDEIMVVWEMRGRKKYI